MIKPIAIRDQADMRRGKGCREGSWLSPCQYCRIFTLSSEAPVPGDYQRLNAGLKGLEYNPVW